MSGGRITVLRSDRALRRELLLCAALTGLLAAAGLLLLGWAAGLFALAAGLLFSGLHLHFVLRRMRELAALSEAVDRVLHGQDTLLSPQEEGELAVLQSEIRKMTVRLRDSADALRQDKVRLSAAIADISHQLRTPLTAMNLTVSLLSERTLSDERRLTLTRELRRSLQRVDWLVETLLKLSRIDAGTVQFAAQTVRLRDVAEQAVQPLAVPLELRGLRLTMEIGGETFTGDAAWSAEALGNVVKNCMEHTPAGGSITLRAQQTPIFTELTVHDTGPGFSEEDLPHLFERFYCGKHAKEGSVGIGLALARSVLAAQNGTIRAANDPKGGALFTLRFYSETV